VARSVAGRAACFKFAAAHQAHEYSAFAGCVAGKIMARDAQERNGGTGRRSRSASTTAAWDSTPLFIMLAGAYAQRTGRHDAHRRRSGRRCNRRLAGSTATGDSNQDGFVDYARASKTGLANQGWKDSVDSILPRRRQHPARPVALVEVQGLRLCGAARDGVAARAPAAIAENGAALAPSREGATYSPSRAVLCSPIAKFLRIARMARGGVAEVRASNAGQLLYTKLPSPRRRGAGDRAICSPAPFHDGWGIRTLADDQPHFNPMSYHNGSVWPHDTALCAAGIAHYGNRRAAAAVAERALQGGDAFDARLPELYCGFARRPGEPPVGYPVACPAAGLVVGRRVHAAAGMPRHRDRQWRRERCMSIGRRLPVELERCRSADFRWQTNASISVRARRRPRHRDAVGHRPDSITVMVRA
jgi:glycogen debranching enzyme